MRYERLLDNFLSRMENIVVSSSHESSHIYTHPYTTHFMREVCYWGRVGANIREIESSVEIAVLNNDRFHLISDTADTCNLLQEDKTYMVVYKKIWNRIWLN